MEVKKIKVITECLVFSCTGDISSGCLGLEINVVVIVLQGIQTLSLCFDQEMDQEVQSFYISYRIADQPLQGGDQRLTDLTQKKKLLVAIIELSK